MDHNWNGDYKLIADSSWQILELNKAHMRLKPLGSEERYPFEFDVDVKNIAENKVAFQVKVPYKLIWFEEKDDQL